MERLAVNPDTRSQPALAAASILNTDRLLTPQQLSELTGLSTSTLAKRRMVDGQGPRFVRLSGNRVAYRESAVNDWLRARERGSTMEDRCDRTGAAP